MSAPATTEPDITTDTCGYCQHSWHGLACKVQVRAHGYAKTCPCPSAIAQFRGKQ